MALVIREIDDPRHHSRYYAFKEHMRDVKLSPVVLSGPEYQPIARSGIELGDHDPSGTSPAVSTLN